MSFEDDDSFSNPRAQRVAGLSDLPRPDRRRWLQAAGALGTLAATPLNAIAASIGRITRPAIAFAPIEPSAEDLVRVPVGYRVDVVHAWGDPVSDGPLFKPDASNSAAEQAQQVGMHHDGMHWFPFVESGRQSSQHGLLCVNHEYIDDGLLHSDGMQNWSAEKVAKAQAAHGVSVVELKLAGDAWQVVRPSPYARRITADTPIHLSGPAAGSALLKTSADPDGRLVRGTFGNCAMGVTPWGTYLTCEENFNGYFHAEQPTADLQRYGIKAGGAGYRWHEFDERFDSDRHPNEANRFGWVVEIDPRHPAAPPVKRTALGRVKHESATVTLARDGRVVVYMGDDEAFEYVYKFVSRRPYRAGTPAPARLLDEGTLYVARFDADGRGRWLPLVHGQNGLTAANGFPDQASVLVHTRQAADQVGATPMDRPEWIAVHPHSGEVYVSLTNNSKRGSSGKPGVDAANPRAANTFGQLARWREHHGDAASLTFDWDLFVLAGNPQSSDESHRGNIRGDAFACPDGLWFDPDGRLWIETDISTSVIGKGDFAALGNNQMLCADVISGEIHRFLTGPRGCEITGITATPDGRNLFINIQHPGEPADERSDPAQPTAVSAWPHSQFAALPEGRPRSATVVIRRVDGGIVGT